MTLSLSGKHNVPTYKRFLLQTRKTRTCWIWKGNVVRGYGQLKVKGRPTRAHRYSYSVHKGAVPFGLNVLHNCPGGDNKLCVNPDHLWVGTFKENSVDASRKNAMAFGERHG